MRLVLDLLVACLPWPAKRAVYAKRGWTVSADARVGVSVLSGRDVTLAPGARIGHLNVIRRFGRFTMDRDARIGSVNRVLGPGAAEVGDRVQASRWPSTFHMGEGALMFNSNFIDVSGTVSIGARTIMAGGFTRVWSHGPVEADGGLFGLEPASVVIGEDAYVGAGSTILPGATLPPRCIVGAASVLTTSAGRHAPGTILVGNPAREIGTRPDPAG